MDLRLFAKILFLLLPTLPLNVDPPQIFISFGCGQKNQMKRVPMSDFHSLSTYVDHTNYKSCFPRQLRHSYFLSSHVFYDFFHWNSLGPVEIWYGLGGTKISVFHSLSNLLFNWIPFHKNQFLQKIAHCISTRKELTIPNHFSSSLNSICTWILFGHNKQKCSSDVPSSLNDDLGGYFLHRLWY